MKRDPNSINGSVVLSGLAGAAALAAGSNAYSAVVVVAPPADLADLGPDTPNPGPGDFDQSGGIDITDMLVLFALWGPCPVE